MWAAVPVIENGRTSEPTIFPSWASVHPETGTIEPASRQLMRISVSAQHAKISADRHAPALSGKVRHVPSPNNLLLNTASPNVSMYNRALQQIQIVQSDCNAGYLTGAASVQADLICM